MSQNDGKESPQSDDSDAIELGELSAASEFEIEHTRVGSLEEQARAPGESAPGSIELTDAGATRIQPAPELEQASAFTASPPAPVLEPTVLTSPEATRMAMPLATAAAPDSDGGTRVDLGDDLLDKTASLLSGAGTFVGSEPVAPEPAAQRMELIPAGPISLDQVEDLLESARILAGERLLEDAKRVLRKILMADPGRVTARKMLDEIHESELKQIFGEEDLPRRRSGTRPEDAALEEAAQSVLEGLERDFKLGLVEERPTLFRDEGVLEQFGAKMDRELSASPPSERVDIGIAFLEMGLPGLAARHFRAAAVSLAAGDGQADVVPLLMATSLLAFALIEDGKAFEATLALQPTLNDVEVPRERKLDLMYMMGRAFEMLGKPGVARGWYAQAAEIEPHYRDIDERVRGLGRAR